MSDTGFIGKNAVSEDRLNCLLSNVWKEVTYDEYGHWKDRHFNGVPYTCKRVGDQLYKKYKVWAKDWEVAKFIKTFVVSHLVKYLNEYPADENSDWIFDCLIDEFIRDIESDLYPDGYNYGKIEKAMNKSMKASGSSMIPMISGPLFMGFCTIFMKNGRSMKQVDIVQVTAQRVASKHSGRNGVQKREKDAISE